MATTWLDKANIGVDIEEVNRFRKIKFSENRDFYNKIFTPKEISYCLSKNDPYQYFTARFCAKEAILKALDKSHGLSMKSIEILKNAFGAPIVKVHHLDLDNFKYILSLSHTKSIAIAFAIVIKEFK